MKGAEAMPENARQYASGSLPERIVQLRACVGRHRGIATLAAVALFAAGIVWALGETAFDLAAVDGRWMLALALCMLPALALNAAELRVTARMLGSDIPFGESVQVTCWAMLANLLPLPGGAMLRGAKLYDLGIEAGKSGQAILAGGALWVSLAVAITLLAVVPLPALAIPLALALCGAGASMVWLVRLGPAVFALQLAVIRIALIGLTIVRIFIAFRALDLAGSWIEATAYSGVSVVGTVVGIVPAGIGITEAMGSVLAILISASPADAFLALSLNRLIGLGVSALIVAGLATRRKKSI